jgi:hypothetical protein
MVIGASTVIEAAVAGLCAVVGIVTGGLVRAVVINLPNAVSAVYLCPAGRSAEHHPEQQRDQRGGRLLIPASQTGLGPRSGRVAW